MSQKLRSALLEAIQRDEDAERELDQEVQAAQDRQDELRREQLRQREVVAAERLAGAFERIADSLQKIAAIGLDLRGLK